MGQRKYILRGLVAENLDPGSVISQDTLVERDIEVNMAFCSKPCPRTPFSAYLHLCTQEHTTHTYEQQQ